MRCVSFEIDGRHGYGLMDGNAVYAVREEFAARYPDLRSAIAGAALAELGDNVESVPLSADAPGLLPVIPEPGKILCVGVNYRPHVEEMGRDLPDYPVVFVRFPSSLVGHGQPLLRPRVSSRYDYEGELAVVIGRAGRYVSRDRAWEHVAGLCPFLDGSVRDYQRHSGQFTPGKNFPGSGAMGPALVTLDEIGDPDDLQLETRVNAEVLQRGRLSELIFDVPRLIAYCSLFTQLEPGDVIATGTPGGVGAARRPPRWLVPGDTVEVDIGPAGCLRNPVIDEASAD